MLLIFNPVGTATNAAIQKYMNSKKVPQLFVGGGATKWNNPTEFPWTIGFQPNYQTEGRIFAQYVLNAKPDARIAVLYQNDDLGKDYLKGLKDGLGSKSSMIIMEESYEISEPTVDSHIVKMRASGADVFVSIALPKGAAQSIREGIRDWLEAAFHPVQHRRVDRYGDPSLLALRMRRASFRRST